jgi:hypothetical protein
MKNFINLDHIHHLHSFVNQKEAKGIYQPTLNLINQNNFILHQTAQ